MTGRGSAHLRTEGTLLRAEDLVVEFPAGDRTMQAVAGVSLDVLPGETLGLVGESGCGKSTTGRALLQLPRPTSGSVIFDGVELTQLEPGALRRHRRQLQMILQDPIASLNPRRAIEGSVEEPLLIWERRADDRRRKVDEVLDAVGLDPVVVRGRRPHEFSGGQCQRICIARALILGPRLLICDEPVSALDVSVQGQILNLLEDLKQRFGLTLIFIAHDLAVVKSVSDRVAVMYLGRLCEVASSEDVFARSRHPYTEALVQSIPSLEVAVEEGDNVGIVGELPSPLDPPSGCRFRTRCPRAARRCADEEPIMRSLGDDHYVACHFPLDAAPAS
jgi:peptide/nickel transport system ATP-binding protein